MPTGEAFAYGWCDEEQGDYWASDADLDYEAERAQIDRDLRRERGLDARFTRPVLTPQQGRQIGEDCLTYALTGRFPDENGRAAVGAAPGHDNHPTGG